MEAHKDARVPKILDIVYQRLYSAIFMLAGMTSSSYPQSVALLTEMVSTEPIPVHQETVVKEEPAAATQDKEKIQPTLEAKK